MIKKAGSPDYGAQIRAIMEALGVAEGRGRPITQEEFAHRVGAHVSAVKKWISRGSDRQTPGRDSLIAINKIAPSHLRFTLNGNGDIPSPVIPSPAPQQGSLLDVVRQSYIRGPDGRELTKEEFDQLVALIRAATRP